MKTKRTIKSIFCALIVVLTLFSLVGCGMEVDVYEQQDEDNRYFMIDFCPDDSLIATLEDGAAQSERHDGTWTLENWLCDYFAIIAELQGFTYRYDKYIDDGVLYSFTVTVPKDTAGEEIRDKLTLDSEMSIKTNLFMRTINVVRDDRFNVWISEYEEVLERFESDSPVPSDNATMLGIFLFGCGSYTGAEGEIYEEELPGFTDAFPAAKPERYREVVLQNFWYASRKMNVNCDDRAYVRDSDGTVDKSGVYYIFRKEAGDGETLVEYEYYRADPTGWYIVALAGGGIAIGVVILVARYRDKKKHTPPPAQVKDLFPYDPFADNGGNINPFDGY